MACDAHTILERRALWHVAKRLMLAGYSRVEAMTALYNDWRPPFDYSRVRWAVEDGEALAVIEWAGGDLKPLREIRRRAMYGNEGATLRLRKLAHEARDELEAE